MYLNDFIFVLESVYFICCCSITNTIISLVAHKQQVKTSSKLKVHRTNSQKISSCPVSFSIFQIYSFSFVSFFCFLSFVFLTRPIFWLKVNIFFLSPCAFFRLEWCASSCCTCFKELNPFMKRRHTREYQNMHTRYICKTEVLLSL